MVVDPLPIVAHGVAALLESTGFEVKATASKLPPDVDVEGKDINTVVVDPDFPDASPSAVVRSLARSTGARIIVLTATHPGADRIQRLFDAGAHAVVKKSAGAEDLFSAIRMTLDSNLIAMPRDVFVSEQLQDEVANLTAREVEVLKMVCEGQPNAAIARNLWVTEQTVKFHLSNVYRKLGVSNRTEAASRFNRQPVR